MNLPVKRFTMPRRMRAISSGSGSKWMIQDHQLAGIGGMIVRGDRHRLELELCVIERCTGAALHLTERMARTERPFGGRGLNDVPPFSPGRCGELHPLTDRVMKSTTASAAWPPLIRLMVRMSAS